MTPARALRLLAACLIGVTLLLGTASPAAAHATLQSTTPSSDAVLDASPTEVVLTFSEAVDIGLGGIKVIGPDGQRVDRGDPTSDRSKTVLTMKVDAGDRGTHTVVWTVTSEDNHTISGSFLFSVGAATGAAEIADTPQTIERGVATAGRAAAFAGSMLFMGALVFAVVLLRNMEAGPQRRRLASMAIVGGALVVVGSLLALLGQIALSSGRPLSEAFGLVPDAIADTRFGTLGLARAGFGVSAIFTGLLLRLGGRNRGVMALAAPSAAGLVIVPALTGHAWATPTRAVAVAVDAVHFLSAGVWIGGLAGLLTLGSQWGGAARAARRFSTLALGAVATVVVTGLVSSFLQVRFVDGLTETGYGRLLLIKVAFVAVLVGLGWLNRRKLASAVADAGDVLRVVRIEAVVALAVLLVTATLVNRPPARTDLARPFSGVTELVGVPGRVQLEVQPAKVGENDVHAYFLDERGVPAPIDAVEMTLSRAGVPPRIVKVTPVTADHVSAYNLVFPSGGRWVVSITAARDGQEATAEMEVSVR